MARLARVVVPGLPHHVTQRGNRQQDTFFKADDFRVYLDLMAEWCAHYGVEVWAYCLMTNHVHLIAVPESEEALGLAIGEAHRRYTRRVNFREGWRGHLWQGRFASFPMDERHLLAAARYVELNPVRAKMVKRPEDYIWSSARAHLSGKDDRVVKAGPLLDIAGDWAAFMARGLDESERGALRRHERTGRPLGDERFIERLETTLGRPLKKKKPGPKKKRDDGE
ncbi:MAG TPA: transposase [Rhodospirillales bacterium]|nr:transposase [Rhodospirillales bacterium]